MKKNAILFSASNYTKSPLIQINNLPGVKYDIQAMHKRLTQIGFEVKLFMCIFLHIYYFHFFLFVIL